MGYQIGNLGSGRQSGNLNATAIKKIPAQNKSNLQPMDYRSIAPLSVYCFYLSRPLKHQTAALKQNNGREKGHKQQNDVRYDIDMHNSELDIVDFIT